MAYPIANSTYAYETILNTLLDETDGISLIKLRNKTGIPDGFNIPSALSWKGKAKQEQDGKKPHYETNNGLYSITPEGIEHLNKFENLIQKDIPNIEIQYKLGHNPDGSRNDDQIRQRPANQKQQAQTIEEPIQLSATVQKVAQMLQDVAAVNQHHKNCLEEVCTTLGKFFEQHPTQKFDSLKEGMLADVVNETDSFRLTLKTIQELTEKTLVAAIPLE